MHKIIFAVCAFIVFVAAVFFCARSLGAAFPSATVEETEDENFLRGKALLLEQNDAAAMEAFYKVVNAREDAPEAHLELGVIALRREMPLDALFHFRQYMRQSANEQQKRLVEEQCAAARKMFLAQLPGKPFETDVPAPNLEKKFLQLSKENDALKRDLQMARRRISDLEKRLVRPGTPPSAGSEVVAETPAPRAETPEPDEAGRVPVPATHTVQPGDTLVKISKKYYGTQNRWKEIYNYNRDVLRTPSSLKVGAVLKLPPQ